MADEDVQHLSNLRQLDTVQARLAYSARYISWQEPSSLARIGIPFYTRFKENGNPVDIDTTIAFQQHALYLTPEDHIDKPMYLYNLGQFFLYRFERLGDLADVDKAICLQREAVDLTPEDHTNKHVYLNGLAASFVRRYARLGDFADIESAICLRRQAIDLTAEDYPYKHVYLNGLGASLTERFRRLGDIVDIDSAIRVEREAVDLAPEGYIMKPTYLNSLGHYLMLRFERLGDLADVDSAIRVQSEAVNLTPEGHIHKPRWQINLGVAFTHRFERLGDITDINSAIRLQCAAIDVIPNGHAAKPMYLNDLGILFMRRSERLGDLTDVDSAIRVQHEAVNLTPEGHINKHLCLNSLGASLAHRFQRLGDLADVDGAIRVQSEAIDITPEGNIHKPGWLNNLGISFRCRFERFGDITDVDSAIRMHNQAVDLTREGHTHKHIFLSHLGIASMRRFERLGDLADIDSAIRVQRAAINIIPDGHAAKPACRNDLGDSFRHRFQRFGEMTDFQTAIDVFRKAANDPSGPSSHRLEASRQWALLLSSSPSTSSPLEAYRVVLALVPRMVWLGSNLCRRSEALPAVAEVVSEAVAAAIAAGDLTCALEWLEEGRRVIWGQMLQLRTPLDDLRAVDPELAGDLERTSRALDDAGASEVLLLNKKKEGASSEDMAQQHRRLAEEYEWMVEKVRALPGCEDFLRPKRLAHLRAAADSGPVVVVTISKSRCDAMILLQTSDAVLHVPLPTLRHEDVAAWKDAMLQYLRGSRVQAREMRECPVAGEDSIVPTILADLWSKIVQPVLFALGHSSGDKPTAGDLPHLTWCATGPLAFLPLHAAGIYDEAGGPKVFDYVVSSYTPTLSALIEAGRRANSPTPSVLTVSQLGTGQHSLPGTVEKIAAIQTIVGNHGLHLDGENATKDSVLAAMENHNWIHLACHTHQNIQDPTKSAFILYNSQLDLLSIMQRSFKHTELAFLSACQTATGDEKLTEEAAHLAAGMLMAGYSSVVATMWSIKDTDAPVVAKEFYSRLMEEGGHDRRKVAYALHAAVKRLRDEVGEKNFVRWVPFIHVGI